MAAADGARDHARNNTTAAVRFPVSPTMHPELLEGKDEAHAVEGTAEVQPAAPRGACESVAPPESGDTQPVGHPSLAEGLEALPAAEVQPAAWKGACEAIGAPDSAAMQPAVHASLAAAGHDLLERECAAERLGSACAPVSDAGAASCAAEGLDAVTNMSRLPPGGVRLAHPADMCGAITWERRACWARLKHC